MAVEYLSTAAIPKETTNSGDMDDDKSIEASLMEGQSGAAKAPQGLECGLHCCCFTFRGADFAVLAPFAVCTFLLYLLGHPYKRIIEEVVLNSTKAHDPALSYPLLREQVSEKLLIALTTSIPLCTILVTTLVSHLVCKRGAAKESIHAAEVTDAAHPGSPDPDHHCRLSSVCEMVRVMTEEILKLMQTLVLTVFITHFIKYLGGRPRPNFYALGPDTDDARESFPSGHSSFAFASMTNLSLYLWTRCKPFVQPRVRKWLALPLLIGCLLPMAFATWVAMTRTQDYRHNFDDVLAGSVIGLGLAVLVDRMHEPTRDQ